MPDLPSRVTFFRIGADEVLTRSAGRPASQRLSEEAVWTPGSDINIGIASSSAMAEEVTRQLALGIKALFLDGADGAELDRLVADRFSPTVVRLQATPAVATLRLTRASGAFAALTLPIGTRVATRSGVEFVTTAAASLPLGSSGPVDVAAQASIAGLAGNVAANTLTAFVVPPPDPAIVVTNPETAAGGDDRESDARLRARARDFYRTARRGTLGAIEFGALTVAGIRQATAIEEIDADGDPTGRVSLYVADALGQANTALVTAVLGALLEYRGAGVVVDVIGTTPAFVAIRYRLRFAAGVNTVSAADSVRLGTIAAVNLLRPAETLQVSLLTSIARAVPGVIVDDDAVQEPVGDLIPAVGTVIRTRADLISFE